MGLHENVNKEGKKNHEGYTRVTAPKVKCTVITSLILQSLFLFCSIEITHKMHSFLEGKGRLYFSMWAQQSLKGVFSSQC